MPSSNYLELAADYFLDDVPGAVSPASRLRNILESLATNGTLSIFRCEFLHQKGYEALYKFASGQIDFAAYRKDAMTEQARRLGLSNLPEDRADRRKTVQEALRSKREKDQKEIDEEQALRDAQTREKNAVLFAAREEKLRRRRLQDRFGLGFIDGRDFPHVMHILRTVDQGKPITERDLVWLADQGFEYWTYELRANHHRIVANGLTQEWQRTGDPWMAVNACSHWRKAYLPKNALPMTEIALEGCRQPKIRSALCTTRGGVMRDLNRFAEAVDLGHEAHALAPKDFRPCTLLGAVCFQMGAYSEGAKWYERAEKLGASRKVINKEIQTILAAASAEERRRLTEFLKSRGLLKSA